MFKTGLVSISFRNLSAEEIIRLTKESGLAAIEWGSDVHAQKDDIRELWRIREQMDNAGLYTSSYGTYFRVGENSPDELCDYLSAANILGTKILRLWCGRKNYEDMTEAERQWIIEESKRAADIAERAGVTFCMECHNNTFTSCSEGALRLMNSVNSGAFGMYWQPSRLINQKANLDYASAISPYARNIHVFNWSEHGRHPLSSGLDVWGKYVSHFDGTQHLLLEFMPDNSAESLLGEAMALAELANGINFDRAN